MDQHHEFSQYVESLEIELLNAQVRSSAKVLGTLLSDDFVEFGASGNVWNKKEIISSLVKEQSENEYKLEAHDLKSRIITENTVLITYRCIRKCKSGEVLRETLRSSIWKQSNRNWQLVFHQGTMVNKS